jgi:serine/threonine protein kinase
MIGTTVSHYKILEKLGEGGMGVVYKARDTLLDRFVALKFLSSDLTSDESLRSRFIHEARAASMLDHPNIAVIHEIGQLEDGRSFISMAYYEGETLRKRLDRGPLDIGAAIRIAVQICDGLQHAHAAGIVHRDIKPANIIIVPDGTSDGTVKIVDFGVAKLTGQASGSSSGRLVGTTAYMSPEQIQGTAVDHRSDLFSLGIVLYEMLTGKRPFRGEHEAALLWEIVHDEPAPPSSLRSGIPAGLEQITMQLLRKDPAERFQSAGAVADALNAGSGEKIRPPSAIRTFVLSGRRRFILPVAGIAIISLAVGILTSRSGIALVPTDIVMVADVENNTSEGVFDHSLTEALIVSLRQSAHLNLLPPERIAAALERMQITGERTLADSTALSVAKREGARVMVAAGIGKVGSAYVISGKVVDVASGKCR